MKLMKFFFALSILVLITSCAKEEANMTNEVFTEAETSTQKVIFPEGVTLENAAEWFNQLSEEEREEYIIKDSEQAITASEEATSRACTAWSPWTNWLIIRQNFSCVSRRCPNPQSQEFVLKCRSRVRHCHDGPETQTQTSSTTTCYPPC